jgi:hypothetical protein
MGDTISALDSQNQARGKHKMQLVKKLWDLLDPADDISLHVKPIVHGGFGVYANTVLISIHADKATADAHCQRLRNQQAADK